MQAGSLGKTVTLYATNPIFVGLVVMLCVGLLAYRTFGLFTLPSTDNLSEISPSGEDPGLTLNRLNLSQLATLHLFGKANSKPADAGKPVQEDIPETRLKLILQGAFTSTENEVSSALIATDKRSDAQLYRLGDEVPGNAVLHEVQSNYVLLRRGGRLEKLLFPREQNLAAGGTVVESSRSVGNPNQNGGSSGPEINRSLKSRLQNLRKQLNQNEEKVRL